jgi:hypothetical protein
LPPRGSLFAQFERLGIADATIRDEAHAARITWSEVGRRASKYLDDCIADLPNDDAISRLVAGLHQHKNLLCQALETEEATLFALYVRSCKGA